MRRVLVLLGTLLLLMIGLSACGDDGGDKAENTGSVTVTGKFGAEPKVTFEGTYRRADTETTVLSQGDGEKVEDGDSVFANLYIANGYTGRKAASTWEDESAALISLSDDTLPGIKEAVLGHQVGSRIEVQATPDDAFGKAGNEALAIAAEDPVVFVVDIISKVLDGVTSTPADQSPGQPKIVQKDDKVTGLDFAETAKKAPAKTQSFTLVTGDGPAVEKSSTIAVRYLGQVWGGKKPFDENYSTEPTAQPLSSFVKGWQKSLVGVKAGSRVLIYVTPADGYGPKGSGDKIKGTDTMVFVVDVLGVN